VHRYLISTATMRHLISSPHVAVDCLHLAVQSFCAAIMTLGAMEMRRNTAQLSFWMGTFDETRGLDVFTFKTALCDANIEGSWETQLQRELGIYRHLGHVLDAFPQFMVRQSLNRDLFILSVYVVSVAVCFGRYFTTIRRFGATVQMMLVLHLSAFWYTNLDFRFYAFATFPWIMTLVFLFVATMQRTVATRYSSLDQVEKILRSDFGHREGTVWVDGRRYQLVDEEPPFAATQDEKMF